jgi:seryl-tRNA synthetase
MGQASEALLALKPVTFHYKKEIDPKRVPQFGLVAEDVEEVNRDLVVRDNAMLLNEFLKAHRKMEEQQKQIDALTEQLKEQAAQIQKVSAQLELSQAAPTTVLNDQ